MFYLFRYAKISEPLTSCMVGAKLKMPNYEDSTLTFESIRDSCPFFGQIGPVYLFNDAISSEQVQSIYSLGPSYMYSFLDNEALPVSGDKMPSGIHDAKDGLASRIIFGLNAQVPYPFLFPLYMPTHAYSFIICFFFNRKVTFEPYFIYIYTQACLFIIFSSGKCWQNVV